MGKGKGKARKLRVTASAPFFYQKSQEQKSPKFLEKYKKRSAQEWKNGEMKRFHGMSRARGCKEADVCILYYRWLKKYRYGAHFVALHHTQDGFVGYNTYRTSKGPDKYGSSLESFLKQRKYFGAVLFCIRKK